MADELWRECANWLIRCQVIPRDHRVTWVNAQVIDLANTLRDGVLLCHLLNNLVPGCVDLKEISLRPQMSQFLCRKNISAFLQTCQSIFELKATDLFEPYMLFDCTDFVQNAKKGTLEAKTWYRMVWVDHRLAWNESDFGNLTVTRVPTELIWIPSYYINNSLEPGEMRLGSSKYNVLIYPDGTCLWVPNKRETTSCLVNLRNFPYDEHECQWELTPGVIYGDAVSIRLYNNNEHIEMEDYWVANEWTIAKDKAQVVNNAKVTFTIYLKRRSQYYTFSLIIPLIVAWSLVLSLFWLPPAAQEKVTIAAFATLFLFIQFINIYYIVPHNETETPRIVIFTGTTLLFALLSFLISISSVFLSQNSKWLLPSCLLNSVSGPCGTLLCLDSFTREVPIGAKLLSDNGEASAPSEKIEHFPEVKQHGDSDWTLVINALNRICFIAFCFAFFVLLLSCLLT